MKTADDREEVVFREAVKRTKAPEREDFLDQACAGNQALHGRLETFLRTHVETRKTTYAVTGCFCLLVVALLLWRLAGDGFHPRRLFRASDDPVNSSVLDSFSKPSVALAILHQEVDRLMFSYTQSRGLDKVSQWPPLYDGTAIDSRGLPASVSRSPTASDQSSAAELSAITLMVKLHAGVQNVEMDLDRNLLTAYYQHGLCNEFVDCFLRLIQQGPDQSGNLIWLMPALEGARRCGRAEEVTDALRHEIRFHQNSALRQKWRAVLERWEAQNVPD